MCDRKSFQGSVTKHGKIVMVSVKLHLPLVPGPGFMTLSVSGGRHYMFSREFQLSHHFPIPGLHEEVAGAGQPVTGENFAVM